tara:strand:- start:17244 stop:17468 length:225 start_codon:yes stop_codon:yes gene_type:complete
MKFVSMPIFLVSLSIGLFLTYITNPPTRTIFVFPTPDNVDDLIFKDNSDNCFTFKADEVDCPENSDEIENYAVQ